MLIQTFPLETETGYSPTKSANIKPLLSTNQADCDKMPTLRYKWRDVYAFDWRIFLQATL